MKRLLTGRCIIILICFTLTMGGCFGHKPQVNQDELIRQALDLYLDGWAKEQAGDYDAALVLYAQSLSISPRPVVYYRMGVINAYQEDYEKALEYFRSAMELSKDYQSAEEASQKINWYLEQKNILAEDEQLSPPPFEPPKIEEQPIIQEEDLTTPSKPKLSFPPPPPPPSLEPEQKVLEQNYLNQGRELVSQGKIAEALALYQEGIEKLRLSSALYYNAANILYRQGKYEEAITYYQRALTLKPDYVKAYNNLGITYEAVNRLVDAEKAYLTAIKVGQLSEAYYNLGVLYEKRGKLKEAVKYLRLYLEKDISPEWSEDAQRRINQIKQNL